MSEKDIKRGWERTADYRDKPCYHNPEYEIWRPLFITPCLKTDTTEARPCRSFLLCTRKNPRPY